MRARRRGRADAANLARHYADLLAPLLPVGEDALRRGLTLFERHHPVGASEPSSPQRRWTRMPRRWSADAAFADVAGLTHLIPDDPALARFWS